MALNYCKQSRFMTQASRDNNIDIKHSISLIEYHLGDQNCEEQNEYTFQKSKKQKFHLKIALNSLAKSVNSELFTIHRTSDAIIISLKLIHNTKCMVLNAKL